MFLNFFIEWENFLEINKNVLEQFTVINIVHFDFKGMADIFTSSIYGSNSLNFWDYFGINFERLNNVEFISMYNYLLNLPCILRSIIFETDILKNNWLYSSKTSWPEDSIIKGIYFIGKKYL